MLAHVLRSALHSADRTFQTVAQLLYWFQASSRCNVCVCLAATLPWVRRLVPWSAVKQAVRLCLQEHHITAYDQLFQDGHRRMLRQEEYAHWCVITLLHASMSNGCPHQASFSAQGNAESFQGSHVSLDLFIILPTWCTDCDGEGTMWPIKG